MASMENEKKDILWRPEGLSVPPSAKHVVAHFGTDNFDYDEPKAIIDATVKTGNVILEILAADVNITLIGLLPRNLNKSKWRNKILKVNSYLKNSFKYETNIYYLERGRN